MKSIDKAIRMTDSVGGVDVKHIAQYLWSWEDGEARSDIASYIQSKAPSHIKTKEEYNEYARGAYQTVINSVYADLKKEVNRMLEAGYKTTSNKLKNLYSK